MFGSWFFARLWCFVRGHRMHSARVYDEASESRNRGFICRDCGHTSHLASYWQDD